MAYINKEKKLISKLATSNKYNHDAILNGNKQLKYELYKQIFLKNNGSKHWIYKLSF